MADLLKEIPHCCDSCAHLYKMFTESPCDNCDHNNLWVPNDYLRHLAEIKKEKRKNG